MQLRKTNDVTNNCIKRVKGVTNCSIRAKNAVLSQESDDQSLIIPREISHPTVINPVQIAV